MTAPDPTESNLRAYAVHQRVVGAAFWVPTSLLYLIDQVGLTLVWRTAMATALPNSSATVARTLVGFDCMPPS